MCGIAGYRGTAARRRERGSTRASPLMRRRGPDFADAPALARDRTTPPTCCSRASASSTSIRAPTSRSARGTQWMVCNGELYNYVELRRELERAGRSVRDAIGHRGVRALARPLRPGGSRPLARACGRSRSTTRRADSLTLCRDRFGEKPLYLFRDATACTSARRSNSSPRCSAGGSTSNIDHLRRYLVNGYKALYKTDADVLPRRHARSRPATCLTLDARGAERPQRYWQPRGSIPTRRCRSTRPWRRRASG